MHFGQSVFSSQVLTFDGNFQIIVLMDRKNQENLLLNFEIKIHTDTAELTQSFITQIIIFYTKNMYCTRTWYPIIILSKQKPKY